MSLVVGLGFGGAFFITVWAAKKFFLGLEHFMVLVSNGGGGGGGGHIFCIHVIKD